jgi:hypothetical protein
VRARINLDNVLGERIEKGEEAFVLGAHWTLAVIEDES